MTDNSKRTLKIIATGFLLLALAWQHVTATRLGYQVARARQEGHSLRARLGGAQLELETTLSPAQLAAQAKSKLGMFPAPPEALRILGETSEAREAGFLTRFFSSWRFAAANG